MCNPAGIDVDPNTAVQEASGDNNNQESFNSKNSVITEVNITTSALFICLIFGVFVLVIVLYILHKVNIRKLDQRIHTLAHLTGFGEEHTRPINRQEQLELQEQKQIQELTI